MGRLMDVLAHNAADLLFNFAVLLIVYLIARILRANMLTALAVAVMPPLLAYAFRHPTGASSLLALLR